MSYFRFFVLAALATAVSIVPLSGSPLSFTGNFTNDNDVKLIPFTVPGMTLVTFQTFGYGGGTNGAGQVILPGGFESMLQLFDAPTGEFRSGSLVADPPAPACAPRKPDPNRLNFCFDVFAQLLLSPGDYILALTQSPNSSAGSNLSDGFIFDGDPNFAGGFVGITGLQGDSHYALDITLSPEPGAALLIAPALLLIGVLRRRRSS